MKKEQNDYKKNNSKNMYLSSLQASGKMRIYTHWNETHTNGKKIMVFLTLFSITFFTPIVVVLAVDSYDFIKGE